MKTINSKKLVFTFLVTIGLFSFSSITKADTHTISTSVTVEETDEPDIAIEPWMTSNECFVQLISKLNNEKYDCSLYEENEEPIPIEGWMLDITYMKFEQRESKTFNTSNLIEVSGRLL